MIEFPSSTAIGRVIPKEEFYKRLTMSNELKTKFVTDVRRITLENSLTKTTLNLEPGKSVTEILVIAINLKKQEFDYRIIESITRQNKHQLVFLLRYEDQGQLSVYYNKLYKTQWEPLDSLYLEARGFTIDEVWIGFLEQIALQGDSFLANESGDIDIRLKRQESIERLEKEITKTEKMARTEKQPKKRFELYLKLQHDIKKLKRGGDA